MVAIEIIGTILGSNIASAVVTYFVTKKKYNVEVDANIIQNMQDSLEFYKKLCDDNTARLQEVLKRNEELNAQVLSLQKEVLDVYKFLGVQSKQELESLRTTLEKSLKDAVAENE